MISLGVSLGALAVSAFVSATLFPGASEVVFLTLLAQYPDAFWIALAVASFANSAGSMTSYVIGRLLPNRAQGKAIRWCERYGVWALLLAWVPIVGDAIPVAAGWLRLSWVTSALMILLGKSARYLAVGWGYVQFFG